MPKTKRKRKHHNKTHKHKGGTYMGCGAFGKVYGDPRLPCSNETVKEISGNNEVSKLFRSINTMNEEYDVVNRLKRHFNDIDYDALSQFFILPIKHCSINPDYIKQNDALYGSKQWKRCPNGQFDPLIFTSENYGVLNDYKSMIVYPKGVKSVKRAFHDNNHSPDDLLTHLNGIVNLMLGIQLFQDNGFVHADIKTENAVVCDDGHYRFIDMSFANHITEMTDLKRFVVEAFNYWAYPPTVIYLRSFDENLTMNNSSTKRKRENETITSFNMVNFKMLSSRIREFRYIMATIHETIPVLSPILKQWFCQKTYNAYWSDNTNELLDYVVNTPFSSVVPKFNFDELNSINDENNFESRDHMKKDLLMRIDIYSVGLMLLECLSNYCFAQQTAITNEAEIELINGLCSIIQQCCGQYDKCADIEIISGNLQILIDQFMMTQTLP